MLGKKWRAFRSALNDGYDMQEAKLVLWSVEMAFSLWPARFGLHVARKFSHSGFDARDTGFDGCGRIRAT